MLRCCKKKMSLTRTAPSRVVHLPCRRGEGGEDHTELVFVGDRGMVKAKGKRALATAGFRYITALTTPQVRRLLQTQVRPHGVVYHARP